ncbi:ATPase, T2SS/T4P/T4SS family [Ramlibacter sp. AN1133]|uniref:ATPase, T2SS/T4P/T4SS family n=1 Tax=Ramlibacter sp. AN1133 TaxID=3133429 RepID=UPI0030BD6FC4
MLSVLRAWMNGESWRPALLAPQGPSRTARRVCSPARGRAASAAGADRPASQCCADREPPPAVFAGVRFAETLIAQTSELARVSFHRVVNEDVKLGQHLFSRIAVAQLSPSARECLLFADRGAVTVDEVAAVVEQLRKLGWALVTQGPQGYWMHCALVMSLSQGHIDAHGLAVETEIARDPNKNALFTSFKDIVSWGYAHNADDIDFAIDLGAPKSQVCFKIGGRYVRPPMWSLATDTLVQMLGIAWQKSSGGADAAFQARTEQQAKVELELQRSSRLPHGARVRLRWSGMANDRGTVVTLRLQRLGESARIRSLESAGYPRSQMEILRRVIHSEGGMTVFSGVVGSGKSTSLAQLLRELPRDIKMISIEDPVELEIPWMYQKTVTRDLSASGEDSAFRSAVAAIYRSALDVLLLGEVRDVTTGMIARQVAESGHSVYTTTHAKGALGIIDRFASPAIGMPREVLATPDILKVLVYQALLPTTCPHCGLSPADFAAEHQLGGARLAAHMAYFERIERLYGLAAERFRLRNPRGCAQCSKSELPELNGYSGRTVVSEMIEPDDEMLRFIMAGNNVELTRYWRSLANARYDDDDLTGKTAMECAVFKAGQGIIDPREIEPRFMSFETVEQKRCGRRAEAAP